MRILHVADTHLGMRQYGLEARRKDFSKAFDQVVSVALEARVDAVIHAGDLFDNRYPSMEDLTDVLQMLRRLREGTIPFLGIVGNHEGKRGAQWLDFFEQFGLSVHLNSKTPFDLNGVPVWGVDYLSRNRNQVKPPRTKEGILVMHQLLNHREVSGNGELLLEDLAASGAKLVLLGDYHEHKVWREGSALITYPGSTERVSAVETRRRGFTIIDYDSLALERRELDTRRFVYIGTKQEPVIDPIAELEALAHSVKDAVVVIRLGSTDYTPRQLYQEGLSRGALHVIVRRATVDVTDEAQTPMMAQLDNVEQIDAALLSEIERQDFSDVTVRLDQIVRDLAVPDSKVDERITQLLEEVEL